MGATMTRRLLAAYRTASIPTRLHVWGRWRSCPFAAVEASVPAAGQVLDIGCGHGLFSIYMSLMSPERDVLGVDIDLGKLAIARGAARRAGASATFAEGSAAVLPHGPWDAIALADVLYLLTPAEILDTLRRAARSLAPGGRLLVKDANTEPRWKLRLTRWQEVLATRVLRITQGEELTYLPPHEMISALEGEGLVVEGRRLDRWSIHPHHLIVATRPAR